MQQFFIESITDAKLSPEQLKQCLKVLRMRQNDLVRLVDSSGKGGVFKFNDDSLESLDLIEPIEFIERPIKIRLIASLIRNERLEWMIQKACELGVDEIILYSAQHGVVKDFGARTDRKLERLNTIALEACEQAYRQHAIKVSGIIDLKDLASYKSEQNFVADVNVGVLPHLYQALNPSQSLSILIGPEGGFSEKERQQFKMDDYVSISLGDHVLRAETASMVACTLIHAFEVNQ